MTFDLSHPIRKWAVEYAGQLLPRCLRSTKDGKTSYERRRGKTYKRRLPTFSEAVMYMAVRKGAKRVRKCDDRWKTGIFVGLECFKSLVQKSLDVKTKTFKK